MRRAVSIALAVLVAVGVGIAIVASVRSKDTPSPPAHVTVVRGVIGSEKQPFFEDPRVRAEFRKKGLDVEVDTAGSRQIATLDLKPYGFAFPAGVPAAVKIKAAHGVSKSYTTFYTPMAIASWRPIADLLVKAGVATNQGSYYTFDVAAYLRLVAKNTRWSDLPGNTSYPVDKSILVTSTDVRTSNSAAMYLSIASYVSNQNNVVQDEAQADAVSKTVEPLFLRQGFVEASTEEPFEDYLAIGIGKTPMVMIYEAQFVARVLASDPAITSDMVLMYPSPDVLSKHTFIPLTPAGDRVGQLLLQDPVLQRLAIQFGFRTSDAAAFAQELSSHHLGLPRTLLNIIEPPAYEPLERMITDIEQAYQEGGSGT